ncbi:MAG: GNAT family N-acetyltransferase [Acidobacteriota bacterium]|nr:GNAT family N-acetyltransferase [Acidobacteriota bacterium]
MSEKTNPVRDELTVEVCRTLPQMRECVKLQRAIWNDPDEDLIPPMLLVVANKIGGQVLLARDGAKAVGFALAFPAFRGESRYLHSHIVGVVPEYQNRGVGRRIKVKQRELALEAKISSLEWTFDPLALRNAHFNVVRLGAVIRRFHANLYGVTASPLHGGLPTDRVVAEWRLSSARVESALAGKDPVVESDAVRIVVPAVIEEWKTAAPDLAAEVQSRLKLQFEEQFGRGFAVTGFRMEGGDGVYLLEPSGRVCL